MKVSLQQYRGSLMQYLKKATASPSAEDTRTRETVSRMLAEIESGGEQVVRRYNREFDGWEGDILVSESELEAAAERLPLSVRADLDFAHRQVQEFARHQLQSMREFEIELESGVTAGQRLIPVSTAGCYVPGGRYAHAASAIMSICTARVAGVEHIVATTPPQGEDGAHPAILYAMHISGATQVLYAGGVQGVAALAFGIATDHPADIIVGPGNRYVAEAKRQLFGRIGIDVIAGPTENLVIADETADAGIVAADLAGQAEHGADSPVWLITTSESLGREVLERMPSIIAALPEPACTNAARAWEHFGEIALVADREEACRVSDRYAPEHLQVQAADLDWWLQRLRNYGSLFLGEETTVAFGDKCSGPNHILPTRGAARYSGGLSVGKFIKSVSYQRLDRHGSLRLAPVSARISRLEGMEGHARTSDVRMHKYFPDREFSLVPPSVAWPADTEAAD
jgi:sulfopropanediol 3-dehydrogenase